MRPLTGSEKAGSVVAAQAAKHIKKATLELGGNDVFVVLDDADLKAVKIGVQARLNNAGQVCTAAKRFILHEKIADAFLSQFTQAFREVKIGDPLDESTTLGPLSSKDALETLTKQVDEAVKKMARNCIWAANPRSGKAAFFEPTILTGITRDNPAYFEEFFGPVAQIYVVKDDDEAVKLANDSHYGLGGADSARISKGETHGVAD